MMQYRAIVVNLDGQPYLDKNDSDSFVQRQSHDLNDIYRWAKNTSKHFHLPVQIFETIEWLKDVVNDIS